MRRRVVITGAGVLSPVADSPAGLHAALSEGRSGLKSVELFAADGVGPRLAGEVRPFEPKEYLGEKKSPPGRPYLASAPRRGHPGPRSERLERGSPCRPRGGARRGHHLLQRQNDRRVRPPRVAARPLAREPHGLRQQRHQRRGGAGGHLARPVGRQLHDLPGRGLRARRDRLRGGPDPPRPRRRHPRWGRRGALLRVFRRLRPRRPPLRRQRLREHPVPFDTRRNGFAPAEGAALLMLEDADSAAARGATVLAEIAGHGAAFDVSRSEEDAAGAVARAVRLALADAGLSPAQIDCLSASANGSLAGDRAEARGIATALGERAAVLPVSAIKSMLGEALGASGGFQAAALLGTFTDGVLPGILGLKETEAGFPLKGVSPNNQRIEARRALLSAVGADGHCCALVLTAPEI